MKNAARYLTLATSLFALVVLLAGSSFAKAPQCKQVGGAILTNLGGFGEIDGNPTTLGLATGYLKGALGVQVLTASPDFTSITVQHHWVTEDGETLSFDQATLHGAYVGPNLLAVTEYKVHLRGGTGRFSRARAELSSIGELDFNTGHAILRYSGTICFDGGN